MGDTEKYTDRDILIRIATSHEKLLDHFQNGKFTNQIKEGIKEQTTQLIADSNNKHKDIKDKINPIFNNMMFFRTTLVVVVLQLVGLLIWMIRFG